MGAFYGSKILNGDVNPKTTEAWKIEDVPSFWRSKTLKWLDSSGYTMGTGDT